MNFWKKILSKDIFLATVFILAVMWGVSKIEYNIEILSPIQDVFSDFQITDLAASKIREEMPEDTNIVLINIGQLNREQLAQELVIIAGCKPKVIGIDAFFRRPKDPQGDSLLARAMEQIENLVLVSKLHYNDTMGRFDSLERSHPMFLTNASTGFANLITEGENSFRTARTFSPFDTITAGLMKGRVEKFFALQVADIYKPGASNELENRRKDGGYDSEIIWYRGNIYGLKSKYYAIDAQDILDSNFLPSLLANKIVLMGFMGNEILTGENIWDFDKFFTPLNDKYVGKAVPDMFGVVVHANIISMILHNHYVNVSNIWLDVLVGFLFCFFSVVAFHFVLEWLPQLFDPITKLAQFALIIGLTFLQAYIYLKLSFKLDFGIALLAIALAPDLLEIYLHLLKRFVILLYKKIYIRGKIQFGKK